MTVVFPRSIRLVPREESSDLLSLDEKIKAKHARLTHNEEVYLVSTSFSKKDECALIWYEQEYKTQLDKNELRCMLGLTVNLDKKYIERVKRKYKIEWFSEERRREWLQLLSENGLLTKV